MLSTLRKLLNKNPLKEVSETDRNVLAICIGAAFIFWLILNLSREYSIRKTITIRYQLDPERVLVETDEVPLSQDVVIEGSGWDLIWESLRWSPIELFINLRGQKSYELSRSSLENRITRQLASGGLRVADLDFSSRTIYTNPRAGKRLPVVSRVTLDFAEGYLAAASPRFQPDSVTVSGSADVLDTIQEWYTEILTLKNIRQDMTLDVRLNAGRAGVVPSRDQVRLIVDTEAFIQRVLEVPVTVLHAPLVDSFQVIPSTVQLTVSLPKSKYARVTASDFTVVADLEGNPNDDGRNVVPLELRRQPRGIVGAMMDAEMVEYYLIRQ